MAKDDDWQVQAAPETKADYYLLMPEAPFNGKQLYNAGSHFGLGYGYQQQGQVNALNQITVHPTHPAPHVIVNTADEAHAKAQLLAKQHNCQYYVTKLTVMGMYVPPPAEWKPVFTNEWNKP